MVIIQFFTTDHPHFGNHWFISPCQFECSLCVGLDYQAGFNLVSNLGIDYYILE